MVSTLQFINNRFYSLFKQRFINLHNFNALFLHFLHIILVFRWSDLIILSIRELIAGFQNSFLIFSRQAVKPYLAYKCLVRNSEMFHQ